MPYVKEDPIMAIPKPRKSFEFFATLTDPLLACNRLFHSNSTRRTNVFIESKGNSAKSEVGPAPMPEKRLTKRLKSIITNKLRSIFPSLYLSYFVVSFDIPSQNGRKPRFDRILSLYKETTDTGIMYLYNHDSFEKLFLFQILFCESVSSSGKEGSCKAIIRQ